MKRFCGKKPGSSLVSYEGSLDIGIDDFVASM